MYLSIQKANFWKRISAWMFDAILALTLAMAGCLAVSTIINYDVVSNDYNARLEEYYEVYGEKYSVDLTISQEDYDAMTEQEKADYEAKKSAAETEMYAALNKDEQMTELYSRVFTSTLTVLNIGVLISYLLLYFVVPLLFKNGQTLGKKIFGLAVIRTNCVKVSNPVLFIRSIVGLYAMETMVPVLLLLMIYFGYLGIVGTIAILLLFALQIGVMIKTKTNSSIHDLLSDTIVVDYVSQRIFESQEERDRFLSEQAITENERENV